MCNEAQQLRILAVKEDVKIFLNFIIKRFENVIKPSTIVKYSNEDQISRSPSRMNIVTKHICFS